MLFYHKIYFWIFLTDEFDRDIDRADEKLGQNKGLNVTCGKWTARLGIQK